MADILIKNMELPTEERIQLSIYPDGTVVNHSTFKVEKNRTTAIELPEHGRLIDADVIGNRLREQHVFSMPTTCKIDSIIKNAPTVLEATE